MRHQAPLLLLWRSLGNGRGGWADATRRAGPGLDMPFGPQAGAQLSISTCCDAAAWQGSFQQQQQIDHQQRLPPPRRRWHQLQPHRAAAPWILHSSSSSTTRQLHTSAPASISSSVQPHAAVESRAAARRRAPSKEDEEEEPRAHARASLFVSEPWLSQELDVQRQREQLLMGRQPPAFVLAQRQRMGQPRRVFFPTLTLQMMRLPDEAVEEIRRTGWTREVAFRTTPNVTKLEIKAYLEQVYGMKVERVSTINYLGRKFTVSPLKVGKQRAPITVREDDWKKAYVMFAPPPGVTLPPPQAPEDPLDTLRALRTLRQRQPTPAPSSPDGASAPKGASLLPLGAKPSTYLCPRTGHLINPHPLLLAPHPGSSNSTGGSGTKPQGDGSSSPSPVVPLYAAPAPTLSLGLEPPAAAPEVEGGGGGGAAGKEGQQAQKLGITSSSNSGGNAGPK